MKKRISKRDYYLQIADAVSKRSTCIRRQYGAVIVKNDQIISTGYNGSPRGVINCCDTGKCRREEMSIPSGERYELCEAIHAEQNAIINAGRDRTQGATLYLFGSENGEWIDGPEPCLMYGRMIVNAGIVEVVK